MEEVEDGEKPLVLCNGWLEFRIIGAIGYGEGGRVVWKAEYNIAGDTESGRPASFAWITYVKVSDSEAYQKLKSQTFHRASGLCGTIRREYTNLDSPLLSVDSFTSKGYYCLEFRCMEQGSVLSFMARRFPRGLPELFVLYMLFTALRVLRFIHYDDDDDDKHMRVPSPFHQHKRRHASVHRQISASHIYIDNSGATCFRVMLGYGATVFDDISSSSSSSSSVCKWAAAPEVYGSDATTYETASDIWLVGITALELAYGGLKLGRRDDLEHLITNMHRMRKLPNRLNTKGHLCLETDKRCPSVFPLIPSCLQRRCSKQRTTPTGYEYMPHEWVFSKKFVHLVLACLDLDPTKRPSATELLQNKVFDVVRNMTYFDME